MKAYFRKVFLAAVFIGCIMCLHGFNCVFGANESSASKNTPMLSIVMPVYNVAPYLDEALDSAENQTYKDLEIICVNDGSTDNSPQILESHAEKDSRIKVINQENKGVSEARNVGMGLASGRYIYFFDSDDVMAPCIMEKSIKLLEKHGADALEFKSAKCNYNDKIDLSKYVYKDSKVKICNYKSGMNPFEVYRGSGMVWTRIYRKSFLDKHSICFNKDIKMTEDVLFNLMGCAYMKKLIKNDNIGYCYRRHRPGSAITLNPTNTRYHIESNIMVIRELISFRNKNKSHFKNMDKYFASCMLHFVNGRWGNIKNMRCSSDKRRLAKIAYDEIGKNFAQKYHVKLDKTDKKRLEDLKRWGKCVKK